MSRYIPKWERGEFIAWDGEGLAIRGRHEYVLLANSEGAQVIERGIPSRVALDVLAEGMGAAPRAIHVGFGLSYDINMILRDVPKSKLRRLWESERCEWITQKRTYVMSWRPRKFFRVHRYDRDGSACGGTWWDVWPFFQSSFVNALKRYGIGSPDMLARMTDMKAHRRVFRWRDMGAIVRYNREELQCLVELMQALLASLRAANLPISRWDGPGALAAALLKREGYAARIGEPPEDVIDASQYAYYGGRIECLQYGNYTTSNRARNVHTRKIVRTGMSVGSRHTGPVIHHYDVNSAYPAAMTTLPCRASTCGRWVYVRSNRITNISPRRFAVYHVRWAFPKRVLYPFPWRSARGSVFFPRYGEGWVWTPELRAAQRAGLGGITVLERWEWRGSCAHETGPTDFIPRIYAERLAAKARGDAAEHALKLALNSLYGKLAQRVGAQWNGQDWRLPPFHDLAGAGWITSTVRAQLFSAAMQAPTHTLMLATDGIYSTKPLRLRVSPAHAKRLGEWEYQTHAGATIVQSGVYYLVEADGSEKLYSRGFDADSLDRMAIVNAWARRAHQWEATHQRFIGLGTALAGADRFSKWRTWQKEPRTLALHPWGTKRTPVEDWGRRPARQLCATEATDTRRYWDDVIGGMGAMTTPSNLPWRDFQGQQRADDEAEDAIL